MHTQVVAALKEQLAVSEWERQEAVAAVQVGEGHQSPSYCSSPGVLKSRLQVPAGHTEQ
jgi:hypothetical protein